MDEIRRVQGEREYFIRRPIKNREYLVKSGEGLWEGWKPVADLMEMRLGMGLNSLCRATMLDRLSQGRDVFAAVDSYTYSKLLLASYPEETRRNTRLLMYPAPGYRPTPSFGYSR